MLCSTLVVLHQHVLTVLDCFPIVAYDTVEAMNPKAKQALHRYLSKLDRGDPGTPEDGEIEPR